MKTNKKAPLILIVTLTLVIAIAGVSYAWFASQTGSIGGKGDAARIRLVEPDPFFSTNFKFASALPGERIDLSGSSFWYDGTRDAIIRVELGEITSKIIGDLTTIKDEWEDGDWDIQFGGSYVKDGTVYRYSEERLKEILELTLDENADMFESWYFGEESKCYYIWAKHDVLDDQVNLLEVFNLKFTGEFGGNFDLKDALVTRPDHPAKGLNPNGINPATGLTYDRYWEQESVFDWIGLKAEAIQVTEEAIFDYWGQKALNDIVKMDADPVKGGFISTLEEWNYVG